MTISPLRSVMSDGDDGERITKRALPAFEEVEGDLRAAIRVDGLIGTALRDKNQHGPAGMILLLVITASLTGLVLGALMLIT